MVCFGSSRSPAANGGKGYEPGWFCRTSDHGAIGVDGGVDGDADGEPIECENNNGWRGEPV